MGIADDLPRPGDFNSDGKSNDSVFCKRMLYFIRSSDGSFGIIQFESADDIQVVNDYDADSKADIAFFRSGI